VNEGTIFTLYLPRGEATGTEVSCQESAPLASSGTVLLVEDNPEVASASIALFEELGYCVRWARNAEDALREIEMDGIDLVFSDIVMPGRLDGIGLAAVIKERRPSLPVLLATGYSEAVNKVDVSIPVLRKPYRIHELSQALDALR
jgi:DNA-binding NtrC family response regulator